MSVESAVDAVLEVRSLKKYFPVARGLFRGGPAAAVKAVDGVSFKLRKGETLGLVGESGCGKSTLGRLLTRLLEADEGSIIFDTKDLTRISSAEMRH